MPILNKRTFLKYSITGLAAVVPATSLLLTASASDNMPKSKEGISNDERGVQYLFVETAHSISSEGDKLTLHRVGPTTLFFSDRPERIVGHGTTAELVQDWSEGEDSFASDPPNATLSILGGEDEIKDIVVVLSDPVLADEQLTYTIKVLDGVLPAKGGASSLFIDVIGRPLTPVSVAGVVRRTSRRVVRRND